MAFFAPVKTTHCRQSSRWPTRSLHILKHPHQTEFVGFQRQLYARDYRDRLLAIADIFDQREAGIILLLEALRDPHPQVRELAFNCLSIFPHRPEIQSLLAAATQRQIRCQHTLKQHHHPITALALSPDNRHLLSIAAGDDRFYLWDIVTGKIIQTFADPEQRISHGIFSPDGQHLLTTHRQQIWIWSIATGQVVRQLTEQPDRLTALQLSHHHLFTASADGTIAQWDIASGQQLNSFKAHIAPIAALRLSPDGNTLITAAASHLRTGDRVGNPHQIYDLGKTHIHSLAIHPHQPIFWSGDRQARLSAWNYATGTHLDTLTSWSDRPTHAIVPSPNGDILYQTCGHHINLWHTPTGWPIHQLISHRAPTTALALTNDGQTLISGSDDRTIKLWA
jgi:WD40 repeat protein